MAEPGFTQFLGNPAQFQGKPSTFPVCILLEQFQLSRQEGETNSWEMLEILLQIQWQIHRCFPTFAAMEKSNRIYFYIDIFPFIP